ncbi:SMP-30/gluconolactonase/LRE family protein [Rhodanobacter sp. L36]|uniref:SMP-30/gluconolactonase/LRE family protein n=1 Tax=Rhodanobacter sp. L36 TaxID=1747221 RepID=UPI0020B1698B|nr:SMP-30/gluconolactonase/LRE family protein [Rhodanobacter sp. L36]
MSGVVATSVLDARNVLGEGIQWCDRKQALYWTDIQTSKLYRHRPSDALTESWPMPERLASFALCELDDWLLLGLATRLAFYHLPSGALEPLCEVEAALATRLNDGVCDREGRFVFGTLHEPVGGGPKQPIGSFYRLDTDLSLHRLDLGGVAISNSLAFSPDGRTMYFCDSPRRVIRRGSYSIDGHASDAEDWIDLRHIEGEPDGSTVDAEGGLWNAQWGMGRVVRYAPDGREDLIVQVSARQPTRPALGGAALGQLYVTSARDGLSAQALSEDTQAGNLFCAPVSQRGLPEARFAGHPRTIDAA